jgi:hypothetical protein
MHDGNNASEMGIFVEDPNQTPKEKHRKSPMNSGGVVKLERSSLLIMRRELCYHSNVLLKNKVRHKAEGVEKSKQGKEYMFQESHGGDDVERKQSKASNII